MDEIIGKIPTWMIHQSFRYVLGRQTYAVSDWCSWACQNWETIPENEKQIIVRELEKTFDQDDNLRKNRDWKSPYPLGADCDRQSWEMVRAKYRANEENH